MKFVSRDTTLCRFHTHREVVKEVGHTTTGKATLLP